jgi:hypothetical protein
MKNAKRILPWILGATLVVLLANRSAWTDSLVKVSSSGAQGATDSVDWSQLGGDATTLTASFPATSASSMGVTVTLAGPGSLTAVVCPATPCSWVSGFAATDTLIWTSDAANGGNAPNRIDFAKGVVGAGTTIKADGPGQFTAKIEAFHNATSLGSFTQASDASGDSFYLGVNDSSGANVTGIVYSLTACLPTGCSVNDLAIDKVLINGGSGPTPTITPTATGSPGATPTTTATATATATPASSPSPTKLTAAPGKINFGSEFAGIQSSSHVVTLTNAGKVAASINSLSVTAATSKPSDFGLTSDNCSTQTVLPHKTCKFDVFFKPTGIDGQVTASITVPYNGTSPTIALSGNAVAVTLSAPTSEGFPATTHGSTAKTTHKITIRNLTTVPVKMGSISVGTDFGFSGDTCSTAVLSAKTSCTVTAIFSPQNGTAPGQVDEPLTYPFRWASGAFNNSVGIHLKGVVK